MELYLIRHGKTYGNTLSRYIGITDEPLCERGIEELQNIKKESQFPNIKNVYTSNLKRTIETAGILFPESHVVSVAGLNECNFGEFENKNYKELADNENYQKWIDSNGILEFPGGESKDSCSERQLSAFVKCMDDLTGQQEKTAVFVVHGGTIMNIMEQLCTVKKAFYEWHVQNGRGYHVEIEKSSDNKYGYTITVK